MKYNQPSVEFVVNQKGCQIVTNQADTNVDQVVKPASHDRLVSWQKDSDKLALEELVSVEEDVIAIPCSGSSNDTRSKVAESKLERLSVVASDAGLFLGCCKVPICRLHFE